MTAIVCKSTSGLLAGAAASLTRHVLADAIAAAKAERKDEQINNDIWHATASPSAVRITEEDKIGLPNRTGTIKFLTKVCVPESFDATSV
jgi:hypothetical protein